MTKLNTQLHTSGMLCGKSTWEVFRRVPVQFGTMPDYPWRAVDKKTHDTAVFPTWREAMDYADRMARTYEVVLPRVSYGDHVVAGKGIYSLHVDHREHCTDITLGGWDGITVENRHLRVLGAYLYALGEATQ